LGSSESRLWERWGVGRGWQGAVSWEKVSGLDEGNEGTHGVNDAAKIDDRAEITKSRSLDGILTGGLEWWRYVVFSLDCECR
jgi:hypothetical protein